MSKAISLAKLRTLAVQGHRLTCIRVYADASLDDAKRAEAIRYSEETLTRNLNHIDRSEARESIQRPEVLRLQPMDGSGRLDIQTTLILDARHVF